MPIEAIEGSLAQSSAGDDDGGIRSPSFENNDIVERGASEAKALFVGLCNGIDEFLHVEDSSA